MSISSAFKKAIAVFELIPMIETAVRHAEEILPLPKVGVQKLDLVLSMIQSVYEAETSLKNALPWDEVTSLVTVWASKFVTVFKAVGIFKGAVVPGVNLS